MIIVTRKTPHTVTSGWAGWKWWKLELELFSATINVPQMPSPDLPDVYLVDERL
jgi:hypothetical protein